MSYCVTYNKSRIVKRSKSLKTTVYHKLLFWVLSLITFTGICWSSWSNQNVRNYLLPGDPQITGPALERLVDGMQSGKSFTECMTNFCSEIIKNALAE